MTPLSKIAQSILLATGSRTRMAVLDSGVNPKFPLLRRRRTAVFDCILRNEKLEVVPLSPLDDCDRNGHGSCVESCIRTVAPDCAIDHYRLLDKDNLCEGPLLCLALEHIISKRYDLINLSIGTRNDDHLPRFINILKNAYENDVTIVAAWLQQEASNLAPKLNYAITCKATHTDHPLQIHFHPHSVNEFAASGIDVSILGSEGNPMSVSGASFAAAHVAGLAARAVEVLGKSSPLDIKLILREYAQILERKIKTA